MRQGPVLITGSQRSGTTWVAKVLSHSPNLAFVDEPFNPDYRPARVAPKFGLWFRYVCEDNAAEFHPRLARTYGLHYPLRQVVSLRDRGEWRRFGTEAVSSVTHRRKGDRVVVKDPIAIFSAPWLVDTFGMGVILCVRHPAAFVGSQLKLGWEFDFNNFLRQPLFMRDCAGDYAEEIESVAATKVSPLDQAILLWRIIYSRVHSYAEKHPDWVVVRHEDLAEDPGLHFSEIAHRFGLEWSEDSARYAVRSSSSENPAEVPVDRWNSVFRNSEETARLWRRRLTPDQILEVRRGTEREAAWFYDSDDWED